MWQDCMTVNKKLERMLKEKIVAEYFAIVSTGSASLNKDVLTLLSGKVEGGPRGAHFLVQVCRH